MIRVLHVTKLLNRAGAGRSLTTIARHLHETGRFRHAVASLVSVPERAREMVRRSGVRLLDAPPREVLLEEMERADVVQVEWWNNPQIQEMLRSRLPPCRLVLSVHVAGDAMPHVLTCGLLDRVDHCVTGCPYVERLPVVESWPKRATRVTNVFATTDFDRLEGLERKPHQGFNVGYVGVADFKKMHPGFVRMSARVRLPDVRFIVCGNGHLDLLESQAEALGASERFDFRGYESDIRGIFEVLDVYGYPLSSNPGAELNVQEAMYAGVPPVVFALGGLRDSVIHDHNGLVVDSEAEYAEALEYLAHHPEERARLGENARRFAAETFGGARSAEGLAKVFEQVMCLPKRPRPPLGQLSGADAFADSLEETSRSMEELATHANRLTLLGMREYAQHYPGDERLEHWIGLAEQGPLRPGLEELWVVFAHPDDEVIFFASTIEQLAPRRLRLVCATGDFAASTTVRRCELEASAAAFGATLSNLELADRAGCGLDAERLSSGLRELGKPPGVPVLTHGPLGEYGHRHHVDVFRTVYREYGDTVWCLSGPLPADLTVAAGNAGSRRKRELMEQLYPTRRLVWDWGWGDEELTRPGASPHAHVLHAEAGPAGAFLALARERYLTAPEALPPPARAIARSWGSQKLRARLEECLEAWHLHLEPHVW